LGKSAPLSRLISKNYDKLLVQMIATGFFRCLIKAIIGLTCKIQMVGVEKIPKEGGCIIASNHLGRLDPILVYKYLHRDDIILGIAEKYQQYAIIRYAAKALNALWLDRYSADFNGLRQIQKRLLDGGILVIAPEGTRSNTEALMAAKPGAAYLAMKTRVPVIPIAITGTEDRIVIQNLLKLRRSIINIQIGESFIIPEKGCGKLSDHLQFYTDKIMCQIASLLPAEYRGVYSKHQRLLGLSMGEPNS
jgi:1-acyl-sn-glycerol-3-phosphate acyltransferase